MNKLTIKVQDLMFSKRKRKAGQQFLINVGETWESEDSLFHTFSKNCRFYMKANSQVEVIEIDENEPDIHDPTADNGQERRILFIPFMQQEPRKPKPLPVPRFSKIQYDCETCGQKFPNDILLGHHELIHKRGPDISCQYCNQSFDEMSHLNKHLQVCGRKSHIDFSRFSINTTEISRVRRLTITCEICGKSCYKHQLKTHMNTHMQAELAALSPQINITPVTRPLKPVVENISPKPQKIAKKEDTKSGTIKCDQCDRTFANGWRLRQHLPSHSQDRPFACDLCDKTYKQKGNLKLHILKSHSNKDDDNNKNNNNDDNNNNNIEKDNNNNINELSDKDQRVLVPLTQPKDTNFMNVVNSSVMEMAY